MVDSIDVGRTRVPALLPKLVALLLPSRRCVVASVSALIESRTAALIDVRSPALGLTLANAGVRHPGIDIALDSLGPLHLLGASDFARLGTLLASLCLFGSALLARFGAVFAIGALGDSGGDGGGGKEER